VREEIPLPVVAPVEVTPAPIPVAVVPVVAVPEPVAPPRQPSGLTRELSSGTGSPVKTSTLTIRDIERMPSEEYKRRLLSDKSFAKQVDALYSKKPVVQE
jgi:hypothetical protein